MHYIEVITVKNQQDPAGNTETPRGPEIKIFKTNRVQV